MAMMGKRPYVGDIGNSGTTMVKGPFAAAKKGKTVTKKGGKSSGGKGC